MNPHPPTFRDPQLGLFDARPGDANVVWLESFLQQHGRWILAGEILRWHGRADTEDEKRIIRKLAAASENIISGQFGYKHADHATIEEIRHAENNFTSQIRALARRVIVLRRHAHRKIG